MKKYNLINPPKEFKPAFETRCKYCTFYDKNTNACNSTINTPSCIGTYKIYVLNLKYKLSKL